MPFVQRNEIGKVIGQFSMPQAGFAEEFLDEDDSELLPSPEQLSLLAKTEKIATLNTIKVTTASGKTFDGNETARNNMMSAIMAAEYTGQTSAEWKLADNSKEIVTVDEVKEALALSIQIVGQIVTA